MKPLTSEDIVDLHRVGSNAAPARRYRRDRRASYHAVDVDDDRSGAVDLENAGRGVLGIDAIVDLFLDILLLMR